MTSFSPSTHLSFAQRRGMERVHLPTYRICTITVNKLTRSPPSTLLPRRRFAHVRERRPRPVFRVRARVHRRINRKSERIARADRLARVDGPIKMSPPLETFTGSPRAGGNSFPDSTPYAFASFRFIRDPDPEAPKKDK